jgi:hypothetical protein
MGTKNKNKEQEQVNHYSCLQVPDDVMHNDHLSLFGRCFTLVCGYEVWVQLLHHP